MVLYDFNYEHVCSFCQCTADEISGKAEFIVDKLIYGGRGGIPL
jgi:hypothetical protein